MLGEADEAVDMLVGHVGDFADTQGRDRSVATCRWLRALAAQGDLRAALDHADHAVSAYLMVPSTRALAALRATIAARPTTKPAQELRRLITTALEGTTEP